MFRGIFNRITKPIQTQNTLEEYYTTRKNLENLLAIKDKKDNIPYQESRRPFRECDKVLFYKNYAIEEFYGEFGNIYRVLAPQIVPGGRTGDGGGMRDIGYEFERLGDAYNYIDELN